MVRRVNLLMRLLMSLIFIFLYTIRGVTNENEYTNNLIQEVIAEDRIGVKNRESAIEFYNKKIEFFHLNKKGLLDVFNCSVSKSLKDDDMKYIVFFPEVRAIHISNNEITDLSIMYFQKLKSIQSISFNRTNITGSGFKYLNDNKELYLFDLSDSPITDEGLKYLSEIKYNNPINELSLNGTKVTDAGMPYIAKMKFDQSRINLSNTAVTDEGIKHLAGFKNMIEIFLYNTKVTDKGGRWLESQLPNTTVYWGKHKVEDDEQ